MLARLGEVLYWAGCGFAVLIACIGVYGSRTIGGSIDWGTIGVTFAVAGVVWGIGRATLYVLAAK